MNTIVLGSTGIELHETFSNISIIHYCHGTKHAAVPSTSLGTNGFA